MSEEEAIKEIENYLDYEGSVSIQAIATLYTLYNKEKEENRIMKAEFERLENIEDDTAQLKLLLKEEKEKNKELYKDNQKQWEERCKLAIELDNNTISKDKIREKIEPKLKELDKEIKTEYEVYGNSKELQNLEDIYNFLIDIKELLEE